VRSPNCGIVASEMKLKAIGLSALMLAWSFPSGFAQVGAGQADFRLTKISRTLITSPQFTYTGAEQYTTNQRDRWLEVEVEFEAKPLFTDELTLRYFVLVNGQLLTGEVTHANIPAGRENRSVMYAPPQVLARVVGDRGMSTALVQNITVQIVQKGAVIDELNLARAPAQWYKTLPALSGALLNKNETPFAALYWDRYAEIKPGLSR
jgi:hypothetical protein